MLRESVLNKDPAAALLAREAGPAVNPDLIELAGHTDPKVRRTALNCLRETGGTDASLAMVKALEDDDPQVRGAALKGLQTRPDPASYGPLLEAYSRVADAYARQEIALLAGRMPAANAIEIRGVCGSEDNPQARQGCIAALARSGDAAAQAEFIKHLESSRGRERSRYLEYCAYIDAAWLLKPLAKILEDTSPMVRIGVDARPDLISHLRACDIAVNLVASIGRTSFSFAVNRATNFTPAQIAEVRVFLDKLP